MTAQILLRKMIAGTALLTAITAGADILMDQQKLSYKDEGTFAALSKDPESLLKAKIRLVIVFQSWTKEIPKAYGEFLSDRSIIIIPEDNSQDKYKVNMPLVIDSNIDAIKDDLLKISQGKQAILYGQIKMSRQAKDEKTKTPATTCFYFHIEDIDPVPATQFETSASLKESDYQTILPRYMDLQPSAFVDKKVTFETGFRDVALQLPPAIQKNTHLTDDMAFQFLPNVQLNTPLIAERSNESCIKAFAGVTKDTPMKMNITLEKHNFTFTEGTKEQQIKIYGILKKTIDPTKLKATPVYYFMISKAALPGVTDASLPKLPPLPPPPAVAPAPSATPAVLPETAPEAAQPAPGSEQETPKTEKAKETEAAPKEQPKKDEGLKNILDKLDMN